MTPTVNTILTVIAIVLQIAVLAMYSNAHLKWPLFDPLDYYLLRRKLPKLFSYGVTYVQQEADGKMFERPATIFEKADFLKAHLSLKLRSKRFKRKLSKAIDDCAEKLTLDEEYSDGAISAIVSHIQNTHRSNM